jgi:hypothetical protein
MKKRESRSAKIYHFFVTFPDRVYPFRNEIEGQWVRGLRSYNQALERANKLYGAGHYGYVLNFYRSVFHVLGAIAVITLTTLVAQDWFGSRIALYSLLIMMGVFISYQEFFLQRRTYEQLWRKGILDWLTWCVPIGIYLLIH